MNDRKQIQVLLIELGHVPCRRCKGIGVTFWDSLLDGFANIIGALLGKTSTTYCTRCDGNGKEPAS